MDKYLKLHNEAKELLYDVVDGHVDAKNPKEITDPKASCKVAKVIDLLTKMLAARNKEKK